MDCSINHAHLTVIFVTSDHIPTLLRLVPNVPNMKMIVCMDTVSLKAAKIMKEWSQTLGLVFMEFSECLFFLFSFVFYQNI